MIALLAWMATVVCLVVVASSWLHDDHASSSLVSGGVDPGAYRVRQRQPAVLVPSRPGTRPLHGQLLFAQAMAGGRIGLDCLLVDPTEDDAVGLPVHIVAALPANLWLASVEQELLGQWLAEGDLVDLTLSGDATASRVRIVCGPTTLVLDEQPA